MLGCAACGTRLCGAFGFSNDRSLTYCVLTEIGGTCGPLVGSGAPSGVAALPLVLSVIGLVQCGGGGVRLARITPNAQPPRPAPAGSGSAPRWRWAPPA